MHGHSMGQGPWQSSPGGHVCRIARQGKSLRHCYRTCVRPSHSYGNCYKSKNNGLEDIGFRVQTCLAETATRQKQTKMHFF